MYLQRPQNKYGCGALSTRRTKYLLNFNEAALSFAGEAIDATVEVVRQGKLCKEKIRLCGVWVR
ncbi:MAG: hypothetical protein ACD_69C00103G0002 [uncultured bacterium]|nr:MAG: hypothetical protein ACD_69C00103G0002 [uncultured bacterium]